MLSMRSYCLIISLVFLAMSLYIIFSAGPDLMKKEKAWTKETMWKKTQCSVLAAGISCMTIDPTPGNGGIGSPCRGRFPIPNHWDVSDRAQQLPLVFTSEERAECPGIYYCADEGDSCDCQGEVLYAYQINATEPVLSVTSDGQGVVCSHHPHQGGPFHTDPRPYYRKSCWCKPREVQKLEQSMGHPGPEECAKEADELYNDAPSTASTASVDLLSQPRQQDLGQNWSFGSKLPILTDRVTATVGRGYIPWALVKIDGSVKCAYEYGAPAATCTPLESCQYISGYTYFSNPLVDQAEDVIKTWSQNGEDLPCWVRTDNDCAVSLSSPKSFEESRQELEQNAKYGLAFSLVGLCCVLCSMAFEAKTSQGRELRGNGQDLNQHLL